MNEKKRTGKFVVCESCGKEMYITKKSKKRFCSYKCVSDHKRKTTSRNQEWRDWPEYKEWRIAVYARDNWMCQICGSKAEINAHHIYEGADNPELRFDINNGITLCKYHHIQIHSPNNKELLLQTPNFGETPEVGNPEALIKQFLCSLIDARTTDKEQPDRLVIQSDPRL